MRKILPLILVVACGGFAAAALLRLPQEQTDGGTYTINMRAQKAPAPVPPVPFAATVTVVEGDVEYSVRGGQWQQAVAGEKLNEGDALEVRGTGRAALRLDDGSSVRLDSDTSVALRVLGNDNVVVEDVRGDVYSLVAPSSQSFSVTATDWTYQGHGTAFQTFNEASVQGVEVYDGQVSVMNSARDAVITVNKGEKYLVHNDVNPKTVFKTTKSDTKKLANDEFVRWNLEQDSASPTPVTTANTDTNTAAKAAPTPSGTMTSASPALMILSGQATADGLRLTWTVQGDNPPAGFKLLKSRVPNPTYPGSDFQYLPDGSQRGYLWQLTDGQTYHIRLCAYRTDGTCGSYSNDLTLTALGKTIAATGIDVNDTATPQLSITLTPAGGRLLRWTVDGDSPFGFKVVWSRAPGPTYPSRTGDQSLFFSDPLRRTAEVSAFDGPGDYYVRVCEYLGGTCGLYSNEVMINVGN